MSDSCTCFGEHECIEVYPDSLGRAEGTAMIEGVEHQLEGDICQMKVRCLTCRCVSLQNVFVPDEVKGDANA